MFIGFNHFWPIAFMAEGEQKNEFHGPPQPPGPEGWGENH